MLSTFLAVAQFANWRQVAVGRRKRFEFNWVALAISAPKPFCQFEPGVGTNRRWERARSISIGTEHNMTRGFAEEGSPLDLA